MGVYTSRKWLHNLSLLLCPPREVAFALLPPILIKLSTSISSAEPLQPLLVARASLYSGTANVGSVLGPVRQAIMLSLSPHFSVLGMNLMGNPLRGSAKGPNWIPVSSPYTDHLREEHSPGWENIEFETSFFLVLQSAWSQTWIQNFRLESNMGTRTPQHGVLPRVLTHTSNLKHHWGDNENDPCEQQEVHCGITGKGFVIITCI